MNLVNKSRWANWTLSLALVGIIASGVYWTAKTSDTASKARVIHSVTIEPPVDQLKAGASFVVTAAITVYQVCPYELRWALVNAEDEAILYMIEPVETYPGPGDQVVVSPHFIPAHVPPGKYTYVVQVFDLCANGVKIAPQLRLNVQVH